MLGGKEKSTKLEGEESAGVLICEIHSEKEGF